MDKAIVDNDSTLEGLLKKHRLPGASTAFWKSDSLALDACGCSNETSRTPYTEDSVARIGCIIKLFTATQVMKLHDEGLLDIDAPVAGYLPCLAGIDSEPLKKITAKQLMSHSSGLISNISKRGVSATTSKLVDILNEHRQSLFLFEPGELVSYSSLGYILLCRLIEDVRKIDWVEDMENEILRPLGLKCRPYRDSAEKADSAPLATGVDGHPDENWHYIFTNRILPAEGGSLAFTAKELLDFGFLFINEGVSREGLRILSPSSTKLMMQAHSRPPAELYWMRGYGLGWWIFHDGSCGFSGDGFNNHALVRVDPVHKTALSLVANFHPALFLFIDMWESISDLKPMARPAEQTNRREDDLEGSRQFVGVYRHGSKRVRIKENSGRFTAEITEYPRMADPQVFDLYRAGANTLFIRNDGKHSEMSFYRLCGSQRVNYLSIGQVLLKKEPGELLDLFSKRSANS